MKFGSNCWTENPSRTTQRNSKKPSRRFPRAGRTALYDAVAEGLNHLRFGQWDKKALIIVSDGGDNASRHKYSQVLALAQRSQTLIYSIGLWDSLDQDENPDALKRLCKNTGGIAYFPGPETHVKDISMQIARDLREQYTLGFTPEETNNDHSFRKIEVKVAAPGRGKTSRAIAARLFRRAGEPPLWRQERMRHECSRFHDEKRPAEASALTLRGAFYFFLAAGILALGYAGYVIGDAHSVSGGREVEI